MAMKSLILGGNGFLGSHLQNTLHEAKEPFRVLDHSPARYLRPLKSSEWLPGECNDASVLSKALEGVDCVYHLAGTVNVRWANENIRADAESAIMGSLALLEGCVKNGVGTVVFVSSGGAVYGNSAGKIKETDPTEPISAHGVSKLAVEKYLMLYSKLHGLSCKVARLANPYGPYQDPLRQQGVIPTLLYHALRGLDLTIWGDGSVVRDYVFAPDASQALYRLARLPGESGVFNVGTGIGTSIQELVAMAESIVGKTCRIRYETGRKYDVPRNVLDSSKLAQKTGWAPRVSLQEGMRQTVQWLRENFSC